MSDRFDRLHPKKLNFARGVEEAGWRRGEPIMSWVVELDAPSNEPTCILVISLRFSGLRKRDKSAMEYREFLAEGEESWNRDRWRNKMDKNLPINLDFHTDRGTVFSSKLWDRIG